MNYTVVSFNLCSVYMLSDILSCCGCVRFPVELDSIVGFLLPLATDQFSAHKLCSLLSCVL